MHAMVQPEATVAAEGIIKRGLHSMTSDDFQ